MKQILFLFLMTMSMHAVANAFFAKANVEEGEILVKKNCVSCHASTYGGDGSEIYTRDFRKVESSEGLLKQVRACTTNLRLVWFEEEELNASAYLNKTYYKFEQ